MKKWEIQVIISMMMLTRSSESIFNTNRCTDFILCTVELNYILLIVRTTFNGHPHGMQLIASRRKLQRRNLSRNWRSSAARDLSWACECEHARRRPQCYSFYRASHTTLANLKTSRNERLLHLADAYESLSEIPRISFKKLCYDKNRVKNVCVPRKLLSFNTWWGTHESINEWLDLLRSDAAICVGTQETMRLYVWSSP